MLVLDDVLKLVLFDVFVLVLVDLLEIVQDVSVLVLDDV